MKNDYIFSNELIIGLYGNPISYYFLQSLSLSEHKYSRIQSCTMTLGNITCVKLSKVYCNTAKKIEAFSPIPKSMDVVDSLKPLFSMRGRTMLKAAAEATSTPATTALLATRRRRRPKRNHRHLHLFPAVGWALSGSVFDKFIVWGKVCFLGQSASTTCCRSGRKLDFSFQRHFQRHMNRQGVGFQAI